MVLKIQDASIVIADKNHKTNADKILSPFVLKIRANHGAHITLKFHISILISPRLKNKICANLPIGPLCRMSSSTEDTKEKVVAKIEDAGVKKGLWRRSSEKQSYHIWAKRMNQVSKRIVV